MKRLNLVFGVGLLCLSVPVLGCGGSSDEGAATPAADEPAADSAAAEQPATAGGTAASETEPAEERPKFIAPIRGIAEIAYLQPNTNVVKDEVVTTITVQNRSNGAIAGLKVDEYWWDADGNPLPGDSQRVRQPLLPGEVVTLELRAPRDSRMNRNNYSFTHANGEIKATLVEEITDPDTEPEETGEPGG